MEDGSFIDVFVDCLEFGDDHVARVDVGGLPDCLEVIFLNKFGFAIEFLDYLRTGRSLSH